MNKFSKEAYICMVSGIWSVVVVICSMIDVIDIQSRDNFYGVFTKVAAAMLGVVQFMISANLLAYSKAGGAVAGVAGANGRARSWYYCYLLLAIAMTLIFTFFYVFKERGYYHTYWGFSFFDMVIFFDIAIFVAFAAFHPAPPKTQAQISGAPRSMPPAGAGSKPNGRMNVEWIQRDVPPGPTPQRVVVVDLAPEDMKIHSTGSDLPYGRLQDDSFA